MRYPFHSRRPTAEACHTCHKALVKNCRRQVTTRNLPWATKEGDWERGIEHFEQHVSCLPFQFPSFVNSSSDGTLRPPSTAETEKKISSCRPRFITEANFGPSLDTAAKKTVRVTFWGAPKQGASTAKSLRRRKYQCQKGQSKPTTQRPEIH